MTPFRDVDNSEGSRQTLPMDNLWMMKIVLSKHKILQRVRRALHDLYQVSTAKPLANKN